MSQLAVVVQKAFWIEATRFREVARIHVNALNVDERVEVLGDVVTAERRRRHWLGPYACRHWCRDAERFRYESVDEGQFIPVNDTHLSTG